MDFLPYLPCYWSNSNQILGNIDIDLGCGVKSELSLKVKAQIGIFKCTGIMGQDLVHPYIQSTTVLCDTPMTIDPWTHVKSMTTVAMTTTNGVKRKGDKIGMRL